jgi:hypothetical protein
MGARFSSVFLRVLCGSKCCFHDHQITRDHPIFFPLAAALLKLVNQAVQIRIARAKASGKPVAAALYDCLPIGQHFKLAGLAWRNHGINSKPLFNYGRETRSLSFVISSRGAGTYLNFHSGPPGWFRRVFS